MAGCDRTLRQPSTGEFGTLDTFLAVYHAIAQREEVWGVVRGERLAFYPYALGWRRGHPLVLGLSADGTAWQWIPLAELEVPFTRQGRWPDVARAPRPGVDFLTHLFAEAA